MRKMKAADTIRSGMEVRMSSCGGVVFSAKSRAQGPRGHARGPVGYFGSSFAPGTFSGGTDTPGSPDIVAQCRLWRGSCRRGRAFLDQFGTLPRREAHMSSECGWMDRGEGPLALMRRSRKGERSSRVLGLSLRPMRCELQETSRRQHPGEKNSSRPSAFAFQY